MVTRYSALIHVSILLLTVGAPANSPNSHKRLRAYEEYNPPYTYRTYSSMAFTPDGSRLAAYDRNHGLIYWKLLDTNDTDIYPTSCVKLELPTGAPLYECSLPAMRFLKGGEVLLGCLKWNTEVRRRRSVRFWDSLSGRLLREVKLAGSDVRMYDGDWRDDWNGYNKLAFSPDGKYLLISHIVNTIYDNRIQVWDLETERVVAVNDKYEQNVIEDVSYSPDGKQVLITKDAYLTFADANTLNTIRKVSIRDIAPPTEHQIVKTAAGDVLMSTSLDELKSCVLSPDGNTISVASIQKWLGSKREYEYFTAGGSFHFFYDMNSKKHVVTKDFVPGKAIFSPDGKRIAGRCSWGGITVMSLDGGK